MNREKALKIKALKLEMKLKEREQKQEEAKKQKEQVAFEASMRNYEKQKKAKCRRFVIEQEEQYKSNVQEIKDSLNEDYRCGSNSGTYSCDYQYLCLNFLDIFPISGSLMDLGGRTYTRLRITVLRFKSHSGRSYNQKFCQVNCRRSAVLSWHSGFLHLFQN